VASSDDLYWEEYKQGREDALIDLEFDYWGNLSKLRR